MTEPATISIAATCGSIPDCAAEVGGLVRASTAPYENNAPYQDGARTSNEHPLVKFEDFNGPADERICERLIDGLACLLCRMPIKHVVTVILFFRHLRD